MEESELSEEWIDKEIQAALLNVSVDGESELDTEGHTPGCLSDQADTNDSAAIPDSPKADVSNLFTSYLTSLHTQHTHTQSLLSDAHSTLQDVVSHTQRLCDDVIVNVHKQEEDKSRHIPELPVRSEISNDSESGNMIGKKVDVSASDDITYGGDTDVTMATVKQELHSADMANNPINDDYQEFPVTEECSKEVQVALKEVQLNQLIYEEQLMREQKEMEAVLNAKIQENERKRIEQAKIIAEREAAKRERDTQACLLLQAHTRGYLARKSYKAHIKEVGIKKAQEALMVVKLTQAALIVQRYVRGTLVRREYDPKMAAAKRERLKEEQARMELVKQEARKRVTAAIVIQSAWRGHSCRSELAPVLMAMKAERLRGQAPMVTKVDDSIICTSSTNENTDSDVVTIINSHGNQKTVPTERDDITTSTQCSSILEGNDNHSNDTCAPLHETKESASTHHSPGKLTVSRRIQSALKLLQQQPGDQLSCRSMDQLPERNKDGVSSLETATVRQNRSSSLPLPCDENELSSQQPGKLVASPPERLPSDNSVRDTAIPTTIPSPRKQVSLSIEHVTSPRKPESLPSNEVPTEMKLKPSPSVVSMLASSLSSSRRKALITELQHQNEPSVCQQPASAMASHNAITTTAAAASEDNTSTFKKQDSSHQKECSHTPDCAQLLDEASHQTEAVNMADNDERQLAEEERAMVELTESRAREEMVAQISRERMNLMLSSDEIAEVARRKRAHSTYRHELDHASSPLLPNAWLGLIKERLEAWQMIHQKWLEPGLKLRATKKHSGNLKSRSTVTNQPIETSVLRSKSFSPSKATPMKLLSSAQLLAASPKGTSLEEATQVVLYRPRAPIDMSSFSKCPNLCSLSLNNCGVVTMETLEGCGQLMEISMQSNMMEHVDCNKLCELKFADFSNNRIASIHGYDSCSSLLELNLSENRIARVTGVRGCQGLQRMSLDGNLLINCKGTEHLPLLQHLSCCENHLPKVEGLERCSLLQSLHLSQNNLQQVPHLPDHVLLRELHLDENSLSSIEPITQSWLPLLQTLSLANNCIIQMDALACLVMLQTLDVQNNTIYDLPVLLQAIRGCFKLKCLCIHGNPVTEEPKFKMYIAKALPRLETLDDSPLRKTKSSKTDLPDAISSCPVLQVCSRQIAEQDSMKETHQKEIDELVEANNVDPSPSNTLKNVQTKVSHCHDYQRLLIQHLREHETMPFGRNAHSKSPTKRTSKVAQKKAAILIQSTWKGHRVREWYQRERRARHQAATVIQAHCRGYILRKRLREVLDNAHFRDSDTVEDHFDCIDYDEEIPTDYLDESLLNFDLQPMSPTDAQLERFTHEFSRLTELELTNETVTHKDTPILLPAYTLPGGADDVITYEEWKSQNQPRGLSKSIQPTVHEPVSVGPSNLQVSMTTDSNYSNDISSSFDESSKLSIPEHNNNDSSTESHSHSIEDEYRPSNRVQLAWVNTSELTGRDEIDKKFHKERMLPDELSVSVREDHLQTVIRTKGESTTGTLDTVLTMEDGCRHGNSEDVQLSEKKTIGNEWGFKSSTTADLMRRRAQRQRKLKSTALKRKRLEDPIERLAVFRKQEETKPVVGSRNSGGSSRIHYSNSILSTPSPDLIEVKTKDEFLYQWVHNQRLVHNECNGCHSDNSRAKKTAHKQKRSHSNSSLLPHMEPHVLAGHTPRLMSSDAQNQLVQEGRNLEQR